jgi:hypothetical protein
MPAPVRLPLALLAVVAATTVAVLALWRAEQGDVRRDAAEHAINNK